MNRSKMIEQKKYGMDGAFMFRLMLSKVSYMVQLIISEVPYMVRFMVGKLMYDSFYGKQVCSTRVNINFDFPEIVYQVSI